MMKKVFFFLFLAAVSIARGQTVSPDVISAGGDHSATAAGSVSWTIGEPVSDTYVSAGNIITKGFHQPVNISLSAVEEQAGLEDFFVYPNPVVDELLLDFRNLKNGDYHISVYDYSGKLIQVRNILINMSNQLERISLFDCSKGIYFLNIKSNGSHFSRTIRISKV